MDMPEAVDADFGKFAYEQEIHYRAFQDFYCLLDQRLESLKELISQWKSMQADIRNPIKESALFVQATAVLSR